MNREPTLYLKIANGIEEMIKAGTLREGDRIPSVRQLSRQHKVSMPTVIQAYSVLENRRMIEARPRSGYYVRRPVSDILPPRLRRRSPAAQSLSEFPPMMAMISDITNPRFVPMGGANPSADLLPARKLSRIIGTLARENPAQAVNYDAVPGCPRLRHEVSRRSLDWGCYLQPDDFVLTNGASEALHLSLAATTKPGDTVIVESPCYYGLLNILSHLNLRVIALPADAMDGLDIDAVEEALSHEKVAAIVVIPNFSNPLGSLMPEANRLELIALAAKYQVPIVEDDIYGDVHHEGPRPRCLKALDKADGVILCGSFSKTLAPGYRAGYVAAGKHHQQIAQMKNAINFSSAPLPLLAVAEFLRNGGYDHHLRTLRATFRDQVAKMRAALAASLPEGTTLTNPGGGFVIWARLPEQIDALVLFHQARQANISIAPGHLFSPAAEFKNCIRVSCGYPWNEQIEEAVGTLGKLIARLVRG
ncbi:PLP-dependent aminotransferase family protein [soil metagenome]